MHHKVEFGQFADFYQQDLPSPSTFQSELQWWKIKWQEHLNNHGSASLPSSSLHTLKHATSMYQNIKVLISILCTLPVTTCSAERSFSVLKRTKSSLRSAMSTERLAGLSLLSIHRDIPLDIDAAIDEFSRRCPRRLKLTVV